MGGDIAAWCALRGFTVTLQDREMQFVQPAMDRAAKLFEKKVKDPESAPPLPRAGRPTSKAPGVARADLIIEAIFENPRRRRRCTPSSRRR
jgi:3-hydroxyacyl-CoA dehydrogenase/enoyl-CoA hydratase/3-hydroxybutyryl-CoA epimerase